MRFLVVLLVLLAPIADFYLLFVIAQHIGGWPVIGFVVASALLGGRLARRESRRVVRELAEARQGGEPAREGLLSAGLLAAAGVLLVIPGLVSTLAGLALFVPAFRRLVGRLAQGWVERRFVAVVADAGVMPGGIHGGMPGARGEADPPGRNTGGGRVIDIDEHGRPFP